MPYIIKSFLLGALTLSLLQVSSVEASLEGDMVKGEFHLNSDPGTELFLSNAGIVMAAPGDPSEVEFTSMNLPGPGPGDSLLVTADFTPQAGDLTTLKINYQFAGTPFDIGTHTFWFKDMEWVDAPGFITDVVAADFLTDLVTFPGGIIIEGPDAEFKNGLHLVIQGSLVDVDGDGSNDPNFMLTYNITAAHVPEPSTYALLGSCLAVGLFAKRRKKAVA